MWKMSKSLIVMVLIAMMAAGNALPLWADSAKRTPELRHIPSQRNLGRLPNTLSMELSELPEDPCDKAARLARLAAYDLASRARNAIYDAANEALRAITIRLEAIISDDNLSYAERRAAIAALMTERDEIFSGLYNALAVVGAALQVALALIELNRLLCKYAQYQI